jgi:schlafen family protein
MDAEALTRVIRAGEGPTVEWKQQLPDVDRTGAALCAFANGTGGHLAIGVTDEGRLVGVTGGEAAAAGLREAASRLLPPQEPTILTLPGAEGPVVIAVVKPSVRLPTLLWHTDGSEVAYVRDAASTRRAEKDDLRALSSAWTLTHEATTDDPGHGQAGELEEHEVTALEAIQRMRNTAMKAVVQALHRGRREGRLVLKSLQRRGYLVRKEDGRFSLTAFAHDVLERKGHTGHGRRRGA